MNRSTKTARPKTGISALALATAAALLVMGGTALAAAGTFTAYTTGITSAGKPFEIAAGASDGNLWFTEQGKNKIAKITTSGTVTEYSTGITTNSSPTGITVGPDGNLWFTEMNKDKIGKITTSGTVTEYSTGISAGAKPFDIVAGSDGNLWFTESGLNKIGKITTSGTVTEYSVLSGPGYGLESGPDGNIWVALSTVDKIAKVTTSGTATEYSTGITAGAGPQNITTGYDNNLWFTETGANKIGKITTSGTVSEYAIPTSGSKPDAITKGPDGYVWFTEDAGNQLASISTSGTITEYSTGITGSSSYNGIAYGPDGRLWITQSNGDRILASTTNLPVSPTLSTIPTSPTNSATASITIAGVLGATFTCSVDNVTFTDCTSPWNPFGSPWNLSTTDGTKNVYVKQVTGSGTSAPATASWVLDRTAPNAPALSGAPAANTNSTSQSISFTGEVGATFTCSVDGGAYTACTSPQTRSGLSDGAHSLSVKATDAAGNTSVAGTSSWTVDTVAPAAPVLSGAPASLTNSTSQSISFTGEVGATFTCSVDGGAYTSCTSPQTRSGLSDGSHSLSVKATDAAGNTSVAGTASWTVDATAPAAPNLTGVPASPTKSKTASLSFTGEVGATFTCSVDGAAYTSCTSPVSLSNLSDATHTFNVKQTDTAGNTSVAATGTWTVDALTPDPPSVSGNPASRTKSSSASLTLTGAAGATFTCSVDGGAYSSCSSPFEVSGLGEGSHTVSVKQTLSGKTSAPTSVTWTVDLTPPGAPSLSGTPASLTTSKSASISFSGESGGTFECSLDGGSWTTCTAPQALTNLADGAHSLAVRQTDDVGNTGTSTSYSWTVDTTAPDAPVITGTPAEGTDLRAALLYIAAEPNSTLECRIDGGSWGVCSSPRSLTGLVTGSHTLEARQTDQAGNTSPLGSTSWRIRLPAPAISSHPLAVSNVVSPSIAFSGEPTATFRCSLDGATFTTCTSPVPYSSLATGDHTFTVKQVDADGTVSDTTSVSWRLQPVTLTPPTLPVLGALSLTAVNSTLNAAAWVQEGSVGLDHVEYQWQRCTTSNNNSCVNIVSANANNARYWTVGSDIGYHLRVVVTYVTIEGLRLTQASNTTNQVAPVNTTLPALIYNTGETSPIISKQMAATNGLWTGWVGSESTVAYRWERCTTTDTATCSAISGAGTTSLLYTPGVTDLGKYLRLKMTLTSRGVSVVAYSPVSTMVITKLFLVKASTLSYGSISTPRVGWNTNATRAYFGGGHSATTNFVWQMCTSTDASTCTTMTGMNNVPKLKPTTAMIGKRFRIITTYTSSEGTSLQSASAISPAVVR